MRKKLVNSGPSQLGSCLHPVFESASLQATSDHVKRAHSSLAWDNTCSQHDLRGADLVPRHPAPDENTSVSQNRVEYSDVSLAVPELFPFRLIVHCSLPPAEAMRLPWDDVQTVDDSLSTRYEKNARIGKSCTSATRVFGLSDQSRDFRRFLITDSSPQFGHSLLLNTSPISSDNSEAFLVCHINVTRATDVKAGELPVTGFNIANYRICDAEVGGLLKGPSREKHSRRHVSTSPKPAPRTKIADRLCALAELTPRFFCS